MNEQKMNILTGLIKMQILTYPISERTIEGLGEITESVTISLADTFNVPLKRARKTATKMVRLALAQLRNDMLQDAIGTLKDICNEERN